MKLIKRANRILKINDEQLTGYLENGYSEIDKDGNVINEAKTDDTKELKKQIKALTSENETLKKENEELKATGK